MELNLTETEGVSGRSTRSSEDDTLDNGHSLVYGCYRYPSTGFTLIEPESGYRRSFRHGPEPEITSRPSLQETNRV